MNRRGAPGGYDPPPQSPMATPPPAKEPPADRAARAFWLRAAAFAGVAAVILLALQRFGPNGAGDAHAGAERVDPVTLLAPRAGCGGDYGAFRWQPSAPTALDRYVLTIWDEAALAADRAAPPVFERELAALAYTPTPADPPLPDRITWRVDVQPLERALQRGPTATAWRER